MVKFIRSTHNEIYRAVYNMPLHLIRSVTTVYIYFWVVWDGETLYGKMKSIHEMSGEREIVKNIQMK